MKKLKIFILRLFLKIKVFFKVKLFYLLLLILQYSSMLLIAILCNKVIELLTMLPLFFIYSSRFTKQYHCKTILKCTFTSIGIFAFICLVIPSKNQFLFISIIAMYLLTTASYIYRDWKDKNELLQKKLESLTFEEMRTRFPSYSEYDLKCVYAYINRGTKNADNIAMKYHYSTRQIQRMVKKMREGV